MYYDQKYSMFCSIAIYYAILILNLKPKCFFCREKHVITNTAMWEFKTSFDYKMVTIKLKKNVDFEINIPKNLFHHQFRINKHIHRKFL